MSIIMPQELEVWYLLPALRRELSVELSKLKLNQSEIAKKIGLTRSAVSQYMKSKRAQTIKFDTNTAKEIKKTAKKMSSTEVCLIQEMQHLSRIAKQNKVLCKLHKHHSDITKCCEACLR